MPERNYGYKDGAGSWFITIDTNACDGCGDCVDICPADLWELVEDEFAIFEAGSMVAGIKDEHQRSVRYDCSPCKSPSGDGDGIAQCVEVCHVDAIEFSW